VTALAVLALVIQIVATLAVTGVLAVRLVLPVSPYRPVAAWWRRRIVFAMAPVPGWSPA